MSLIKHEGTIWISWGHALETTLGSIGMFLSYKLEILSYPWFNHWSYTDFQLTAGFLNHLSANAIIRCIKGHIVKYANENLKYRFLKNISIYFLTIKPFWCFHLLRFRVMDVVLCYIGPCHLFSIVLYFMFPFIQDLFLLNSHLTLQLDVNVLCPLRNSHIMFGSY